MREGVRRAEVVDLHRVVDDQLDGLQRVDLRRVAAHALHGVAHGGEVDDGRDAGEVLQQHAAGVKAISRLGSAFGVPVGEGLDVLGRDGDAVLGAQQVFEQDLERERQPLGPG